ncbi:hypothetical protein AArcSl_2920 [Halalkaliarchaeum desulfuricum]|uniref:ParB/Sulfiredoxin domain-containing protein n=1 Tax=Halalkaliarchaeum desulfuricum TaxID=2055893 RepID=A0A343TN59_9EURY|nr:hypothetical protein AArcSl_2920 [Halalkaliarchaeum desulfuricum]
MWDGDWDRDLPPVDSSIKYRSVVERFRNDTPWQETEVYQTALKKIESGESYWNGCRSRDELKKRTSTVDELYRDIRDSGFKSQSEIHGKSVKEILLSGSFDRSKTDVTVAIGRDGEILFVDGNHRFAIAHVLGLDELPVRVVVRHAQWHKIRESIRDSDDPDSLPETYRQYLDHPDIESVLSNT